MDDKYKRILHAFDELDEYEYPKEFDYAALEQNALGVQKRLQEEIGLQTKFEGAGYNQDASFSIAIILTDYVEQNEDTGFPPTIRFSNFGKLATLAWANMLPDGISNSIRMILEEHGFRFIPATVLKDKYDGVMAGNKIFPTWWIRYFDWL